MRIGKNKNETVSAPATTTGHAGEGVFRAARAPLTPLFANPLCSAMLGGRAQSESNRADEFGMN